MPSSRAINSVEDLVDAYFSGGEDLAERFMTQMSASQLYHVKNMAEDFLNLLESEIESRGYYYDEE